MSFFLPNPTVRYLSRHCLGVSWPHKLLYSPYAGTFDDWTRLVSDVWCFVLNLLTDNRSASIIWGFAVPGRESITWIQITNWWNHMAVALNTARDVGSRLWVLTIWGSQGMVTCELSHAFDKMIFFSRWWWLCCGHSADEHSCYITWRLSLWILPNRLGSRWGIVLIFSADN